MTFFCGLRVAEEAKVTHKLGVLLKTIPAENFLARSHLQRDDDHENLLVLIGEDVLNKSPAGANESNGDEQQSAL